MVGNVIEQADLTKFIFFGEKFGFCNNSLFKKIAFINCIGFTVNKTKHFQKSDQTNLTNYIWSQPMEGYKMYNSLGGLLNIHFVEYN